MASVTTRGIGLSMTSTLGSKRQDVVCVATAQRRKRDPETHLVTDELDGYAVNVLSAKGETQTVKLPLESASVIQEIQEALSADKLVRVSFEKFVGRFWAMLDATTGRVNQGVSVTASAVKIASIEDPADELDELMDEVVL